MTGMRLLRNVLLSGSVAMFAFGIVLLYGDRISSLWQLPGDFVIKGKDSIFILPIGTALFISIVLTVLLRFRRRR